MSEVATPPSPVRTARKKHGLSPRERLFVEAYLGDAGLDAVKAATAAGAEEPKSLAWQMMQRHRVREAISRRIAKRVAGKQELLGELTEVATAPWRDFIKVQVDSEGNTVGATLNLGDKIKAADLLLKAQGAYVDPLTRALGKLAMIEVNRLLSAKRKAAKAARIERLSRRHQRLLAQTTDGGAPPPVVDEVEAEVVGPGKADEAGKARQDD